jgi:hypothetical protein
MDERRRAPQLHAIRRLLASIPALRELSSYG